MALSYRKLSSNLKSQRSIKHSWGIKALVNLLMVMLTPKHACIIQMFLVSVKLNRNKNLEVQLLYVCCQVGDFKIRRLATEALRDLSAHPEHKVGGVYGCTNSSRAAITGVLPIALLLKHT